MKAKTFVQWLLIIWFIIINLIILVPSYQLLFNPKEEVDNQTLLPPTPPTAIQIKDLDISQTVATQENQVKSQAQQVLSYTQQITAYAQQVMAYTQQVTAYKLKLENNKKGNEITRYNAVVKDAISPLITGLIAALITFAFVNAGTGLIDNYIRIKNEKAPLPINFW